MERREPEQLNHADAPEEYKLDDIMREFGADADEPKKAASDTMVFRPIRTAPPDPQIEAPMKLAEPAKHAEQKTVRRDESKKEPTRPLLEEPLEAPPKKTPRNKNRQPPPAAPKKRSERVREKPTEEPPRVRIELPETPPKPQELLRMCKDGLGTQRLRLFFLALVTLAQIFLMAYAEQAWSFLPLSQRAGGWITLALAVLSLLLAYDVLLAGLQALFRLRMSLYTLVLPVSVLVLLHALQALPQGEQSYCPVLSLLLLLLLRALTAQRKAMLYTLRTVCSFDAPMGIFEAPQLLKGTDSLRRDTGDTENFMHHLLRPDRAERVMGVYAPVIFLTTGVLAYLLSRRGDCGFVLAWLLLLLGAIPFFGALCFVKPFAALAKRLSAFGGALCGWHGAKIFSGKHTIILRDEDIFPRANITSNGMKLFGSHKAGRVIAYALAALETANSPLTDLFEALLQSQNGKHYHATSSRIYDNNGIGAEVVGEVVLVGSLTFMRSMGVHMSAGTRVRQAVYVSVGGELAGIFAVKYKPSASTKKGLRDVLANRNFSIVLATRDFLISPELVAAKYEVPADALVFPPFQERIRLSDIDSNQTAEQGALIAKDTFGAFASTAAAGRSLRSVSVLSLALCLLAGIGGMIVCALLIVWNAVGTASPLHLAAYQLLWACLNAFFTFVFLRF